MVLHRTDIKDKAICVNCKYCKQESIEYGSWTEYKFLCTNCITSLDFVRGDETYMNCVLANPEGQCELFTRPKDSRFERFLNFIFGKNKEK